jgi:HemY protein
MIRAAVYLILFAIAAAGVAWLADHPGAVTLVWQGYRIDTSVGMLITAAALLAAVAAFLYRFWRWLRAAPGAFARRRRESRRLKGYRALTQGMVAVAAGDAAEAKRQARRADFLLNEPPLTMLLSAQAAQLNGDEAAAEKFFTAMLARPETEFLGLRGLIVQATKAGDTSRALELARRAQALRPKTGWVLSTLHELETRAGEWQAAEETTRLALRAGTLAADQGARNRAVALYQQSLAAEAAGNRDLSLEAARKAAELAPGFQPAAIRAATLFDQAGKRRKALRAIEAGWSAAPHPELARLYLALGDDKEPLGRVMRIQRLVARRPNDHESHLALAEAALAARLWGEARRALEALESNGSAALTQRACRLWASLEEQEHADGSAARAWQARAASAAPDPAWVCGRCGAAQAHWAALCGQCGAYDAMVWRSPAHAPRAVLTTSDRAEGEAQMPRPAEAVTDLGA